MTGVVYEVRRMLEEDGAWTLLGVTGEKRFIDETLPVGVAAVSYMVVSRRGTQESVPSNVVTARIGSITPRRAGVRAA